MEDGTKNIDLDFYNIPLSQTPPQVMSFVLAEVGDQLKENFDLAASSISPGQWIEG